MLHNDLLSLQTPQHHQSHTHLLVVVHFRVVVLDQLVDEAFVLVQHLFPHVGDVVEDGLVLHEEVGLGGAPGVVVGQCWDRREGGEGRPVRRDLPTGSHHCQGDLGREVDGGAGHGGEGRWALERLR